MAAQAQSVAPPSPGGAAAATPGPLSRQPSEQLPSNSPFSTEQIALEQPNAEAVSIDAAVGYQAFNLSHIVATPESLVYNLAGNLMAPLLNRAGIEADYRSANARQLQAVFKYLVNK